VLPDLSDTLLLRLELHDGQVEVDPRARVARIEAGARWGDVVPHTRSPETTPITRKLPMPKIIAVTRATGAQGGGLVRTILDDPEGEFLARAITRDPESDAARALAC